MCTALEFKVFIAGLALQFSIFMDIVSVKDGSDSFVVLHLTSFLLYVHSPLPGWQTAKNIIHRSHHRGNLYMDMKKDILVKLLLK